MTLLTNIDLTRPHVTPVGDTTRMLHPLCGRRKPSFIESIILYSISLDRASASNRAKAALGMTNTDRPQGGNTSCSSRPLRDVVNRRLWTLYSDTLRVPALSHRVRRFSDNCTGQVGTNIDIATARDTRRRHHACRCSTRDVVNRRLLDQFIIYYAAW